MGTTLTIRTPGDFRLARDVCSYGYFLLEPNHWDPETGILARVLDLEEGAAGVVIEEVGGKKQAPSVTRSVPPPLSARGEDPARSLRLRFDRALSRGEQTEAKRQVGRMLALDTDEAELADFHRVDPRWAAEGRGRLFRSPTLFEDVVKTVTSCNVTWPSTVGMNRRLCEVMGRRSPGGGFAFPTVEKLARAKAVTLRSRCRVGYRDTRIVELARLFRKGEVDEAWLRDPATDDEAVFKFLKSLPGIGPYAAGNIMQLLGRYSRLALDSESLRHARAVLKMEGTDAELMKRLAGHYEPFGRHKFRSYWFEVWAFYESRKGPAHTWDKVTTGSSFTAANLK